MARVDESLIKLLAEKALYRLDGRFLNTDMASGDRFPCIVCQSLANSILELHNHQKCYHTSEELSISVIYLVNYMCLQQNMALGQKETLNRFVLPGYVADYCKQKHCIQTLEQADLNRHFIEFQTDSQSPIDYTPSRSSYRESGTVSSTKAKMINKSEHSIASSSGLSQTKMRKKGLTNASSWEMELGKVEEINDEIFLESVDGICQDLKSIARAPDAATRKNKRKNDFSRITMTSKKCHNKKSSKRKFNNQKNPYAFDPTPCYKNFGEVYIRPDKDSKFLDNPTADCSSKNDGATIKLDSFEQTFQHLKLRNNKFSNKINDVNAVGTFQGLTDQNFSLREISTCQEALSNANCKHGIEVKLSMRGSNFRNNVSEQPDISGITKNYVGMSDIDGKVVKI